MVCDDFRERIREWSSISKSSTFIQVSITVVIFCEKENEDVVFTVSSYCLNTLTCVHSICIVFRTMYTNDTINSTKVDNDTKNIHVNLTFDVYSKSAIKNNIAVRNLDIAFENRFSILPHWGSFLLRRKGRYEIYAEKGLGIGRINYFRVLALQTSGSR